MKIAVLQLEHGHVKRTFPDVEAYVYDILLEGYKDYQFGNYISQDSFTQTYERSTYIVKDVSQKSRKDRITRRDVLFVRVDL